MVPVFPAHAILVWVDSSVNLSGSVIDTFAEPWQPVALSVTTTP